MRKIRALLRYLKMWRNGQKINARFGFPVSFGPLAALEGDNRIAGRCTIWGKIGRGTYMASGTNLQADIGRYCSIGWGVETICGRHPLERFVSTHPAFFSPSRQCGTSYVQKAAFAEHIYADPARQMPVVIENDVWIGSYARIIGGVTIHNGAVILAGAYVTQDVPAYAIVGGVPAKVIRYRFDASRIEILQRSRWWDQSTDWLRTHIAEMQDVETYCRSRESTENKELIE